MTAQPVGGVTTKVTSNDSHIPYHRGRFQSLRINPIDHRDISFTGAMNGDNSR
jgi:hypothetical protein